MKTLTINFYTEDEKTPELLDEIIMVGEKQWDLVTYNGEFLPAWVEMWGKVDLSGI